MSMSVGSSGGDGAPMMELNMTPLIDVMLVLIVVLIISIPIMTHATKLDMPQTNNPPPPVRPEVIQIDIDFDGTIVWNGTVVSGIPQLEAFFRSERGKEPQPEIHLVPDRRSRYETTALVMAAAQRGGMKKMGFVNTADFRD
ncbi:MAG: biopolymer transporter ExbD [Pseudomonadota bacterium]